MNKLFLKVVSGFAFITISQLKDFGILDIKKTQERNYCKYYKKVKLYDIIGIPFYINKGCTRKAKYKVIVQYKKYPVCFKVYLCGYHIKKIQKV
jgi:hypothetical protein